MKAAKHAVVSAKEKVSNMGAKAEEKYDKGKASTAEKTEKVMAHDKAGREDAHDRKHIREAEAEVMANQKKMENRHEKVDTKQDIDNRHATANAAAKDAYNNAYNTAGTGQTNGAVQTPTAPTTNGAPSTDAQATT